MTHREAYNKAGAALREWLKENPTDQVSFPDIHMYKARYQSMLETIERELFQAYEQKEITLEEYSAKCTFLEEIDKEIMAELNKKVMAAPMPFPPSLEALLRMLRDRGGEGGGFIVFGGL